MSPRLTDWSLALAAALAFVTGIVSLLSGLPQEWFIFALHGIVGIWLLLLTGSSVIKTLLIPRNLSSSIGTAVARSVLAVYRFRIAKIDDVHRREKILASGAPTYLFVLLVCWIACLYVAYALLLPTVFRSREPRAPGVSESSPEEAAGSPDTSVRMPG